MNKLYSFQGNKCHSLYFFNYLNICTMMEQDKIYKCSLEKVRLARELRGMHTGLSAVQPGFESPTSYKLSPRCFACRATYECMRNPSGLSQENPGACPGRWRMRTIAWCLSKSNQVILGTLNRLQILATFSQKSGMASRLVKDLDQKQW